jgi:hypothetical protein
MTTTRDPDVILGAWLDEGPIHLPEITRQAILTSLPTTSQVERRPHVSWRLPALRGRSRVLATMAILATVIAVGTLLAGGHPAPAPTVTMPPASHRASPAPTVPFGYPGPGTIAFTSHDAAGTDVVWRVDPNGANAAILAQGGCCGLFSPDGTLLALGLPGVKPAGMTRDPSLVGIEVLGAPDGRVAFVVPTGCVACGLLALNYAPDAWSPDGRYLAYDIWSDTDPNEAGMGVADRDFPPFAWGSAKLRVTDAHPDIPLVFSPDSSRLLFLRTEETVGPTSIGSLFVFDVSDLVARRVTPEGWTVRTNGLIQSPASWSPDGQTIVFAATDGSGRSGIFAVGPTPEASIQTIMADAPASTSARFSPDGSLVAFDMRPATGIGHDIFVVRPDGSGLSDLTGSFDLGVCCAQWSPDSQAMLVAGTASDDVHNNLFIVAADGSGTWQVTDDENVYTAFIWGPGFR